MEDSLRRAVDAAEREMPDGTALALVAFVKTPEGEAHMLMLGNREPSALKAAIRAGSVNWGN